MIDYPRSHFIRIEKKLGNRKTSSITTGTLVASHIERIGSTHIPFNKALCFKSGASVGSLISFPYCPGTVIHNNEMAVTPSCTNITRFSFYLASGRKWDLTAVIVTIWEIISGSLLEGNFWS
jgi:hypothetical protein